MEKTQKITSFKFFVIFAITFLGFLPGFAHGADLIFSPASGSYTVGSFISASIFVSSPDQSINAASGIVSFPQDKLEVISISRTGSIFTLWAQDPFFSNSFGTINFEGVALSGFTGLSGKILTINFKVKSTGSAPLAFSSGSILANDGQGTNILSNLGNATFKLNETKTTTVVEPESSGLPVAPTVTSSTHPDSNKWYNANTVKFNWSLTPSVTGIRLLVDKNAKSIPTVIPATLINSRELSDLDDGIWYLHLQFRNINGWGEISHFRFQIDTKKPSSFDIKEIQRDDLTNPKVKFNFTAKDEISGIDHYEIQINEKKMPSWQDNGSGVYETPILSAGNYLLIAKAVDKAGNISANSIEFTVNSLETPKITECPERVKSGEVFNVKGVTYPDSKVTLWVQKEKEDPQFFNAESDKDGNFIFTVSQQLLSGNYKVSTELVDERGAKIKSLEEDLIVSNQPLNFNIGHWTVSVSAVVNSLIIIIIILILYIMYCHCRIRALLAHSKAIKRHRSNKKTD